ncbi:MAG: methyltransferase domain-containing protein [Chitinophagaceae bacterium]|nr:MAG: methyltransferase domain-containing protein [Chitinophagaceae bacterium]
MGSNIFHFKVFSVRQNHAPMKVCTDSCLFGAWAANYIKIFSAGASKLLDIGTGTGLLSLMIAQQTKVQVSAVEIDEEALHDARYNFEHSPWQARIKIYHSPVQNFAEVPKKKFDLVICNPPFFSKSLNSPKEEKNLSKHENNLPLETLIVHAKELLNEQGLFFLLLPADRDKELRKLIAVQNLFIKEVVTIHQTQSHTAFRKFYCIGTSTTGAINEQTIFIKTNKENYSPEFIDLLKPYYLAL